MGSLRSFGRRAIPVGVTLGVTAAAVLVGGTPALAATGTLSTNIGPSAGGNTVVITSNGAFTGKTTSTVYTQFQRKSQSSDTCAGMYSSANSAFAATATAVTTNAVTVTVPSGVVIPSGLSTDYNVCVYPDNDSSSGSAALAETTAGAPYTVVPRLDLSTEVGPNAGGNTLTLTGGNGLTIFSGTTVGVQFQFDDESNYCAATWQAAAGVTTSVGVVRATGAAVASPNSVTVTVPSGLALPSGSTALDFHVCVYAAEGVGTADAQNALIAGSEPNAYTIVAPATLSADRGPSGGGTTVTITSTGAFTSLTTGTTYTQFQRKTAATDICAATYSSAGTAFAATASAVTANAVTVTVPAGVVLASGTLTTDYNVCVYPDNSSGMARAETAVAAPFTIVPRLELSTENGPSGGLNTLTLTGASGLTLFTGTTVGVEFQFDNEANYCSGSWQATGTVTASAGVVKATGAGVLTPNKIAVTVPAGVALPSGSGAPTSLDFHVCVYASEGTSSADTANLLLAGSEPNAYAIANTATVTSVTPTAGPAQGGSSITVVGTNFPASGMTATLGGQALTDVVVATNGLSFTATTPPHAAGGPFKLSVTTAGGTKTTDTGVFTYTNGITISPNTAPNTRTTRLWLDIKGVGFSDLNVAGTAGATPNSTGAHVYLVRGVYEPKPGATAGAKGNAQTVECVDVLVVDDKELVCGLFLAGNGPAVTRTITGCTVALNAAAVTGSTSTTCNFTPQDVGMAITPGNGVQAGTVISAFTSATSVTLSRPVTTAVTTSVSLVLTSARTVDVTGVTQGSAVVTSAQFSAVDVGKRVAGTGIPAGTTVVSVTATNATLSNAASSTQSGTVTLTLTSPVANGTYTITVVSNGAVNASVTDTAYSQSIISSGSTFTVADY